MEDHAKSYRNAAISDYQKETGLEVAIADDEAWKAVFGSDGLTKQSAKCYGGKIYLPYDCSRWSAPKMRLALYHEGIHAMRLLDFQPYLELLDDVGGYLDVRNTYSREFLRDLCAHVRVTESQFMDKSVARQRVYDELCATIGGYAAIDQYEGEFGEEYIKLSDFFRSEQEFRQLLTRLEEVQRKFNETNRGMK